MPPSLTDKSVYVVGPNRLQNSLMASYLSEATGAECTAVEYLAQVPEHDDGNGKGQNHKRLVLWDCLGMDAQSCLVACEIEGNDVISNGLSAFFNVSEGVGIEEKAISYGAEGFFYEGDLAENLAKGVRAIFSGELWIPRKVLGDYVKKTNGRSRPPKTRKQIPELTRRETEILSMVASGTKNSEIASKLFISHHTVRTHLFNIYKKIGVPNRFQAILWAAEHL
jgi:DNA-binding CsgD family transcriptional regulator